MFKGIIVFVIVKDCFLLLYKTVFYKFIRLFSVTVYDC